MASQYKLNKIVSLILLIIWGCSPISTLKRPIDERERIIRIDFENELSLSPEYFGTNGWWTDQDAKILRLRYEELGANIVRLPIIQGIIEPSNDNNDPNRIEWDGFNFEKPYPFFDKTLTYKKWFECLRDLNIKIMIYFPYIAGWLSKNGDRKLFSTYPPKSYDEYEEFIHAVLHYLVIKLNYPAEDIILEPINEPDLRCGQDQFVRCFWAAWQMEDIVRIFRSSCEARNRVNRKISIVGLSECCGVSLTKKFLDYHKGGEYIDALSYHSYVKYNFENGIDRGNMLKEYKKPVFINEYGNRLFWSNGVDGALWHSYALTLLWKHSINPIQFPISEFRGNGNDYRELGLFKDWTEEWEIKPAFWVYRNFYRYLTNGIVVWTKTELPLEVLAVKSNNFHNRLIVCITNLEERNYKNIKIVISNLPYENARVDVNNNLLNKSHIKTLRINGELAVIEDDLLAKSSSCYIIEENNK
jgi:hypothetical protein